MSEVAATSSLTLLLYRAMDSAIGCVVSTTDVAALQMRLSQLKGTLGEPWSSLNIRRSPDLPQQEIWIVKGGAIPEEEFRKKALRNQEIDRIIGEIVSKV